MSTETSRQNKALSPGKQELLRRYIDGDLTKSDVEVAYPINLTIMKHCEGQYAAYYCSPSGLLNGNTGDSPGKVVEGLLREDSLYDREENRSAHREHLVRGVLVEIRDPAKELYAFSRNVSVSGIGLITEESIPERRTAMLTIERLDGTSVKVLAESRWCKSYGKNWFISGWQFLNLR